MRTGAVGVLVAAGAVARKYLSERLGIEIRGYLAQLGDIRLDPYGRPDVDYYINEAKRLRSLAISELIGKSVEWLKTHLGKQHDLPLRPSL